MTDKEAIEIINGQNLTDREKTRVLNSYASGDKRLAFCLKAIAKRKTAKLNEEVKP